MPWSHEKHPGMFGGTSSISGLLILDKSSLDRKTSEPNLISYLYDQYIEMLFQLIKMTQFKRWYVGSVDILGLETLKAANSGRHLLFHFLCTGSSRSIGYQSRMFGYGSKLKTWGTTDFRLCLVLTLQLLRDPISTHTHFLFGDLILNRTVTYSYWKSICLVRSRKYARLPNILKLDPSHMEYQKDTSSHCEKFDKTCPKLT